MRPATPRPFGTFFRSKWRTTRSVGIAECCGRSCSSEPHFMFFMASIKILKKVAKCKGQHGPGVLRRPLALNRFPRKVARHQRRAAPFYPTPMGQDQCADQVVVLAGVWSGTDPA